MTRTGAGAGRTGATARRAIDGDGPDPVSRAVVRLSALIAVVALVASAVGVFASGGPGQHDVRSVRGDTVRLYGEGLFHHDTFLIGVGNWGTDLATLLVEIPLLVLVVVHYRRGSLHGRLLLKERG